jgi:hypothetical protein
MTNIKSLLCNSKEIGGLIQGLALAELPNEIRYRIDMPASLKEVAPKQKQTVRINSLPFLSQPQETMATTIKVAVTQAEPIWLDLQASIKKAVSLVHEAASNGAKIVAFSETWAPGYPGWCW